MLAVEQQSTTCMRVKKNVRRGWESCRVVRSKSSTLVLYQSCLFIFDVIRKRVQQENRSLRFLKPKTHIVGLACVHGRLLVSLRISVFRLIVEYYL